MGGHSAELSQLLLTGLCDRDSLGSPSVFLGTLPRWGLTSWVCTMTLQLGLLGQLSKGVGKDQTSLVYLGPGHLSELRFSWVTVGGVFAFS